MTFRRFVALTFIAFYLCFNPSVALALEDAILAIVNEDIITLRDLKDYTHSLYTQLKMEGRSSYEIQKVMDEIQNNGIDRLIEDKLILSEANRIGMEINETAIQQRLAEIRSAYPDEQTFLKALLNQGATITDLKNKLRDNFKIKYLIDTEIRSKIHVNPQEVTDFYKENFEDFQSPEKLRLKSIFLSEKRYGDLLEDKRNEVIDLIQVGEDFDDLVDNYSDGNPINTVERGQLKTEIEEGLFELESGEISAVFDVPGGYYIFKIEERIPVEVFPLEDVKAKISANLFQSKFKAEYKDWVNQLKEDAFIDIKG